MNAQTRSTDVGNPLPGWKAMRSGLALLALVWAASPHAAEVVGWSVAPELPAARSAHAVAASEDAIFVLGGTGEGGRPVLTLERFDGERWHSEGNIPGEGLNAPAAAVLGGSLYLIGGFGTTTNRPTDAVHRYDLDSGRWTMVTSLPAPRGGHAALVVQGRIHVIGGGNSQSTIADHSVFDPDSGEWTARAALPRAMGSPAAVLHEGELWSVGGRSGPEDFGDVYRYDATADRWVPGPAIAPRGTGGAIVVSGAIHYFGGESQSAQRVLDEVLRLDPRSNEWHRVTHLPTARNFARVVAFKQAYWVIGGSTDYGSSHASVGSTRVERYVP